MSTERWFSRIPEHWGSAPINYNYAVTLGKMLNANKAPGDGVPAPYLAAGSIQPETLVLNETRTMLFTESELASYSLEAGDLVVVEGGAGYGRSHLLSESLPGWGFQNHVARLRPVSGSLVPAYLLYCLRACLASGYVEANNRTATLPSLSREVLGAIRMPIPPLPEQHAIASYLDRQTARTDAVIAEQRRLIEIQRERRQAVIDRAVFGLGAAEPTDVKAHRLIGRHRAVEPLLGRVPTHWAVLRFKAALWRTEERNVDLVHPMMSLKSTGEVVLRSSLGGRQEPDDSSLPRYLIAHDGDLVVNPMWLIGGAIGVSTAVGAVSPDYRVFRSTGAHHPRYLHHLLRSHPYLDQYTLYTRAQTTFDRRVQQPDLDNLPLPVPPMAEQIQIANEIDRQVTKIDGLIGDTERFIELARERRSALITAAVTGQIDVRAKVA